MAVKYFEAFDYSTIPVPVVYTRTSWADPWVAVSYLHAERAMLTSGNSIGEALLNYDYGQIQRHDLNTFATYSPLDVVGEWVKIEWVPNSGSGNFDFATHDRFGLQGVGSGQRVLESGVIYEYVGSPGAEPLPASWNATVDAPTNDLFAWYGLATDETRTEHSESTAGVPTGTQQIRCMSVEWLLTRKQVDGAQVYDHDSGADAVPIETLEGQTFNPTAGVREGSKKNKHAVDDVNGVSMFAKNDETTNEHWDAAAAVSYLLAHYPPITSPRPYEWELDSGSVSKLQWHEPQNIQTHGETLFSLLNQLIPRRRGLIWWTEVDEVNDKILVKVDTVSEVDINLPSGTTIAKNDSQWDVDYDTNSLVDSSSLIVSRQKQYEQVVVEGARRGVLCTLRLVGTGGDTGGYSEGWDSSDRTAYEDGFSNDASYGGLGNAKKKEYNDVVRRVDNSASKTYSRFIIDEAWDMTCKDGEIAYPDVDDSGDLESPLSANTETWIHGIRIENTLPIYQALDYTTPDAPTGTIGGQSEFKLPIFAMDPDPDNPSSKRVRIDELGAMASTEGNEFAGAVSNARVLLNKLAPEFHIIASGMPNHVFARASFNPSSHAVSSESPIFDYQTMIATVYLTFPDRVLVKEPFLLPTAAFDISSQLYIRLGERAHADYMPSGTIYNITSNHETEESTSAGFVRDDRAQMKDLAEMAYQWYKSPRRALSLGLRQSSVLLRIGQMVGDVRQSETSNSVVTKVAFDFSGNKTEIETDFVELDFARLFDV